jgi:hypothetical protein
MCWLDLTWQFKKMLTLANTVAIQIICYSITIVKCLYPSILGQFDINYVIFRIVKIFKNYFFQINFFLKDNSEHLGIFHLLKWILQN